MCIRIRCSTIHPLFMTLFIPYRQLQWEIGYDEPASHLPMYFTGQHPDILYSSFILSQLILHASSFHPLFIFDSFSIHPPFSMICQRSWYSLPIHCLFTAYALPMHCLCTAYTIPLRDNKPLIWMPMTPSTFNVMIRSFVHLTCRIVLKPRNCVKASETETANHTVVLIQWSTYSKASI